MDKHQPKDTTKMKTKSQAYEKWNIHCSTDRYSLKIALPELIFGKVSGLQPVTLLKNELDHRFFSRILPTFKAHLS